MYYDEYLEHYGIPGMRWGHHKKKESAHIQKLRQSVEVKKGQMKTANIDYYRSGKTSVTKNKLHLTMNEHRYAKEDLTKAKILHKLEGKPKSEKQLKLEQKYKEKGMTDNDAAVAAYQRIRTTKILAVTGAVAVTALTAYTAYKIHDDRVDKIIKSGTNLQNISTDGTKGVRDAFFSANKESDKLKYKGELGTTLWMQGKDVYSKNISVLGNIKQASDKNAHKVLAEMAAKDPKFLNDLKIQMANDNKLRNNVYIPKIVKARQSLSLGKVDRNVYEVFNAMLPYHDTGMQPLTDSYYKTMAQKGYNAIRDINDKKYSGYNAKNPIITFGAKGLVEVTNVEKLTSTSMLNAEKLAKLYDEKSGELHRNVKRGVIASSIILASIGGRQIHKIIKSKASDRSVENYKKEHPNTNKSYTEIVRMVEQEKILQKI